MWLARAVMLSIALLMLVSEGVWGQDYPNKPIRILTTAAGGGGDFTARQLAQGISGPLGQAIVVENRPQGVLVAEYIAKSAPPDGYTLSVSGGSTWLTQLLRPTPWDVDKDFAPISLTDMTVFIVAVHPSLPVKSIRELIALAKAKPGQLNYSSSTIGGANHFATELFKSMAGVNIVGVTYKGIAPANTALIGGEVQLTMNEAGTLAPHIKSGKLRGLAVTSLAPTMLVPGLPTVAASGVPEYEWVSRAGVFAPAKTPPAIIARLNQEIVRFLNRPEVKERFISNGLETTPSTPEQFNTTIKSEIAKSAKIIKEANIKVE